MNPRPAQGTIADRLLDLLLRVADGADDCFSGLGVVISDWPNALPMVPLRGSSPEGVGVLETPDLLGAISITAGEWHDGFHVLSSQLSVLAVARYFSPPIVRHVEFDRTRQVGGRYVAALFGSVIPNVIATGIVSRRLGVAVFEGGRETRFSSTVGLRFPSGS